MLHTFPVNFWSHLCHIVLLARLFVIDLGLALLTLSWDKKNGIAIHQWMNWKPWRPNVLPKLTPRGNQQCWKATKHLLVYSAIGRVQEIRSCCEIIMKTTISILNHGSHSDDLDHSFAIVLTWYMLNEKMSCSSGYRQEIQHNYKAIS